MTHAHRHTRRHIIGQEVTPLNVWLLQEGDRIHGGEEITAIQRNALNRHVAVTTCDGKRTTYNGKDALVIVRPRTNVAVGWRHRAMRVLAP